MESLKENSLIKFNENTLFEIRELFNLHKKGDIEDIIRNFEKWIFKQNHFKRKEYGRHYLETSLINAKGSLERAKTTLDKLCSLKSLLPHFFSKHDVKKDFVDLTTFILHATMPTLLKNNYRLYFVQIVSSDFTADMLLDFHRTLILMSEYVKSNDYFFGYTCVIDCRDINLLKFVGNCNIVELRNSLSILMEGYGFRVNAIHLISTSNTVDALISLLKQVVSAKIGSRIHSHKSVTSLYDHVDKKFLPKEYGGEQPSLRELNDNWMKVLGLEENVAYFKGICEAGTDEKYRLSTTFNDQILGMPGSFRTLSVD